MRTGVAFCRKTHVISTSNTQKSKRKAETVWQHLGNVFPILIVREDATEVHAVYFVSALSKPPSSVKKV